jgi:hypothetical protein
MSLKKTYNCVLDWIHAFYRVAFVIRFSIAMTLLAGIAILFADQSLEALRVLAARDPVLNTLDPEQFWPRIFFIVSTLILSLLSWYCARVLLYLIDPLPNAQDDTARAKEFWIRHLPRVVGALPLLFIALALWKAADIKAVENNYGLLKVLAVINAFAAFVLYTFFHLRRWLIAKLTGRQVKNIIPGIRNLAKSGKIILLLTIFLWVFLLILFTMESGRYRAVQAAIYFGPLAIVLLFAAIWTPVGSALVYAAKLTRLPLFLILLILAFSFSAADWNDNHRVRTNPVESQVKLMDVNDGFKQWLSNRCDKGNFQGSDNPYPVFIVSAEGGGLRAGYFAALVLSKLQDADPAFAHHVFAISGVSGGSLGGAVFATLAAKYIKHDGVQPCNFQVNLPDKAQGKMSTLSDDILGHDVLSPILASLLFPDLLQRFLPFRVERFDRARAAEDALGYYWNRSTGGREFFKDYYLYNLYQDSASRQSTFATESTPALFLNTTRVETGEQMVVSNLNPAAAHDSPDAARNSRLNGLTSLADTHPTMSLPLCTAAYLSARFPVVAPAGYLPAKVVDDQGRIRDGKFRYVDGGYFENSGTATVLDLLSAMRIENAVREAGVNIKIVIIRIGSDLNGGDPSNPTLRDMKYTWHGLGEITSPIFALVNGETARGTLSVRETETALAQRTEQADKVPCQGSPELEPAIAQRIEPPCTASEFKLLSAEEAHFRVTQTDVKLPLGYLLSKEARENMKTQIDSPQQCSPNNNDFNYCSFQCVVNVLKGKQCHD